MDIDLETKLIPSCRNDDKSAFSSSDLRGQTSTGVWYPRVIEGKSTNPGPDGVPERFLRWGRRILFEVRHDFDDALFDPALLAR